MKSSNRYLYIFLASLLCLVVFSGNVYSQTKPDSSLIIPGQMNNPSEVGSLSATFKTDTPTRPLFNAYKSEVVFSDGTILRGEIRYETDTTILLYSQIIGERTFSKRGILAIKPITNIDSGKNLVYINLASRYYYSPSAISMKKGDGYYQNIYVLLNSFNYAVTNGFSIGGGLEAFTLLTGKPIFFVNAKAGTEVVKNLHIGGGFQHFNFSLLDENTRSFNLVFATFTIGNPDANVSINLSKEMYYQDVNITTFSGFLRISSSVGLMAEHWIFSNNSDLSLTCFGGRVIGRKNLFDFGILTNRAMMESGIIGVPYLSYTLRF